jgi:G3E family GTPase
LNAGTELNFQHFKIASFFFFGARYFFMKSKIIHSGKTSVARVALQESVRGRRFVLVGGFLGAGKTSVIGELVRWLEAQGLRPGVITNDQGEGLIDTALGRRETAVVREVTGGCFCCRASELGAALTAMEAESQPHVFIAEPVGSCTDLMTTVILPMEQIYQKPLEMAPMSVAIDAAPLESAMLDERAQDKAGRRSGFTADVRYIFDKQLEEAEVLVLNKVDLLTKKRLAAVVEWLRGKNPGKRILTVSTKTGAGLDEWFNLLLTEQSQPEAVMEVDYERYGVGEARMGWYNATLGLHSTGKPIDANKMLLALAGEIQKDLEAAGAEVAHFKMSVGGGGSDEATGLAVVNGVRNGVAPAISRRSEAKFLVGELLVNLRAEAEPEVLSEVVSRHLGKARAEWRVIWKQRAAFKPGQPKPTYRRTSL